MTENESQLSLDDIRSNLNYDPDTGFFTWATDRKNAVKAGMQAGKINTSGYRQIRLSGKHYVAHRLAWFLTYQHWPEEEIDHINLVTDDNRIANLRKATRSQNFHNRRTRADNRAGYKGVCFRKIGQYRAWLNVNHKRVYLGTFRTAEEAHAAYAAASQKYHGEFGRTS